LELPSANVKPSAMEHLKMGYLLSFDKDKKLARIT
jgi:hypothetical protein